MKEQYVFYAVRYTDGSGWFGEKGRERYVHNARQYQTERSAKKVVEKYPTLPMEVVTFVVTEQ